MHENTNFASLISALEKRLALAASTPPIPASAQAPIQPIESRPAPVPTAPAAGFGAYIEDVTSRLARDEYQELRGERAGSLKFKKAMEKVHKGFLGANDAFRVLFVECDELTDAEFKSIEKNVKVYSKELSKKLIWSMFTICVVLANEVPESVRELIYKTKRPKVGITDVSIVVMVAYSAADNDIFYPNDLPDDYDSKFEEKIKQYLLP
jgi:hypothetical protein